jgi:hypothetical protein
MAKKEKIYTFPKAKVGNEIIYDNVPESMLNENHKSVLLSKALNAFHELPGELKKEFFKKISLDIMRKKQLKKKKS